MPNLLSDEALQRSPIVANCRMNRERTLVGSNGYDREVAIDPLTYLADRLSRQRRASWLDLCCGTGRALIEAAQRATAEGWGDRIEILGVDLVGMFDRVDPKLTSLRLVEASLRTWDPGPGRVFDLITCVHGLHYIGDKLGLIARIAAWLEDDGLFLGNFDAANLHLVGRKQGSRAILAELRRQGGSFQPRAHRLLLRGRRVLVFPFRYLGADDQAGPNSTGQPAVDSYYEPLGPNDGVRNSTSPAPPPAC
jgi:SAM-dependent methyltransferase